jgi:hypothetical protein
MHGAQVGMHPIYKMEHGAVHTRNAFKPYNQPKLSNKPCALPENEISEEHASGWSVARDSLLLEPNKSKSGEAPPILGSWAAIEREGIMILSLGQKAPVAAGPGHTPVHAERCQKTSKFSPRRQLSAVHNTFDTSPIGTYSPLAKQSDYACIALMMIG